jgi:hypothetical protein
MYIGKFKNNRTEYIFCAILFFSVIVNFASASSKGGEKFEFRAKCSENFRNFKYYINRENSPEFAKVRFKIKLRELWLSLKKGDAHAAFFLGYMYLQIGHEVPIKSKKFDLDEIILILFMNSINYNYSKENLYFCDNNGDVVDSKKLLNEDSTAFASFLSGFVGSRGIEFSNACMDFKQYDVCFEQLVGSKKYPSFLNFLEQIEKENNWLSRE